VENIDFTKTNIV